MKKNKYINKKHRSWKYIFFNANSKQESKKEKVPF